MAWLHQSIWQHSFDKMHVLPAEVWVWRLQWRLLQLQPLVRGHAAVVSRWFVWAVKEQPS
jgi:hypothetical protein